MSQQDFEVLRRAWSAFSSEDEDAFRAELHPAVEVVPFGAAMDGRVYHGPDQVIDWWHQEILTHWAILRTIPQDYRHVGQQILVTGRWQGRARGSGLELEMPATWIAEVRDGKLIFWRAYTDRSEALRELGLAARTES